MSKDVKKIEVTIDDQNHINSFNKLNNRMHELEAQVAAKKKLLEELEDASNELMLSDEETVRYVVGACFVHIDKDDSEQRLQTFTDLLNGEVADLGKQLDGIKEEMKQLKALLYGKFGKSINLEE